MTSAVAKWVAPAVAIGICGLYPIANLYLVMGPCPALRLPELSALSSSESVRRYSATGSAYRNGSRQISAETFRMS